MNCNFHKDKKRKRTNKSRGGYGFGRHCLSLYVVKYAVSMKRMIPILAVLALLCCGTACHPEENGTEPTEQTDPSGPTGPTEPAVVLVTGITLNETSVPLLVGEGATLTAAVVPDNAGNKAVSWSSSDGSIVKVDGNGKVSAVARGKADIIVSARDGSGISATCTVLVSNPCPEGAIDMGSTTAEGIKVYWAPVNLTATGFAGTQNETGDYFAWGETQPYYTSMDPLVWKDGKSEGYAWTSYQWFKGQQSDKNAIVSKYCWKESTAYWGGSGEPDGKSVLDPEDDAAHVILGGKWRMPTNEEFSNLRAVCQRKWTSVNGRNGLLLTASNGNTLFFPGTDEWWGSSLSRMQNYQSKYWSSSLLEGGAGYAYFMAADVNGMGPRSMASRVLGMAIRPVSD